MSITPDTKDWTWVLERPCPECGFDPSAQGLPDLPDLMRGTAAAWARALARKDARERPRADVWSTLEYACHVRDVHVLFGERLRLMLSEDEPTFANWDQDAAAVERDYAGQAPAVVSAELVRAAVDVADVYDSATGRAANRPGVHSNGHRFTVASLGSFHLHEVVHHLHDVGARG